MKKTPQGEVRYHWNLLNLAREEANGRCTEYVYHPDTFLPLCLIRDNKAYCFQTDHLGTPLEIIDPGGKIVWSGYYATSGFCTVSGNSIIDCDLRSQGQFFDRETGLHYNEFRYYDPDTGRYLTQDPISYLSGDYNLYRYCNNDPVNQVDLLGLEAVSFTLLALWKAAEVVFFLGSAALAAMGVIKAAESISNDTPQIQTEESSDEGFCRENGNGSGDDENGDGEDKNKDEKGKKAKDSGKGEKHGDSGRKQGKAENQIKELERKLEELKKMRKKNEFLWNWDPLTSIGNIRFGELAEPVIEKYRLIKLELDCENADWLTYEFPDGTARIYVSESCIESVGCFEKLFYRGRNLIGMNMEDAIGFLGKPDDIGEKYVGGMSLDYERLAISLFVEDEKVQSCICSGSWED